MNHLTTFLADNWARLHAETVGASGEDKRGIADMGYWGAANREQDARQLYLRFDTLLELTGVVVVVSCLLHAFAKRKVQEAQLFSAEEQELLTFPLV